MAPKSTVDADDDADEDAIDGEEPSEEDEEIPVVEDEVMPLDYEGEELSVDVPVDEPADADELRVVMRVDEEGDDSEPAELLLPMTSVFPSSASFPTAEDLVVDEHKPVATSVSFEFEHCARFNWHVLL